MLTYQSTYSILIILMIIQNYEHNSVNVKLDGKKGVKLCSHIYWIAKLKANIIGKNYEIDFVFEASMW